jgi:hypothetical protein
VFQIVSTADLSDHWITRAELEERMQSMPEADFAEVDAEWVDFVSRHQVAKSDEEDGLTHVAAALELGVEGKVRKKDLTLTFDLETLLHCRPQTHFMRQRERKMKVGRVGVV